MTTNVIEYANIENIYLLCWWKSH